MTYDMGAALSRRWLLRASAGVLGLLGTTGSVGRQAAKAQSAGGGHGLQPDNEAIVRHAYYTAEGSVLDIAGFVGSFAEDGVINLGHAGQEYGGAGRASYSGDQLGKIVLDLAKLYPDVHRELHRVGVLGDTVVIELSVQGTLLAPLTTPAGIVLPAGTKVDIPDADIWYLRDGTIERFDCYIALGDISVRS